MTTSEIPAAGLVLDYNLYPRHHIDEANTRQLRQAIEAGTTLPPVVAEEKTHKVIDGFHRVTASLQIDPNAMIAVDLRKYASDADALEAAIAANASHGLKLTPYDRSRCLILADEHSLTVERVASALTVQVSVLDKLRKAKTAQGPDGELMPIKRSLRHMAGRKLTRKQVDGNEQASGWSVRFHAEQVVMAFEHDLVPDDQDTWAALRALQDVLASSLHGAK